MARFHGVKVVTFNPPPKKRARNVIPLIATRTENGGVAVKL